MAYTFEPAQRGSAKPLIGIYAESGAGKTLSALLLARGFVGPTGRIGMIETESGRGEAYADPKEYPELAGPNPNANYDVLSLRDDFSPENYGKALKAAEEAKIDALIIDSASHEWEGPGGVLSMAADNQAKNMKGVLVWQQPKILHKREFMLKFMQTPIPLVILCMRAKYPMEQKEVNGRKDWARSETLEPTQADDILYEMFVHGWIDQAHRFHLTKSTSKTLTPVFANDQPITLETGRQLAAWAKGATVTAPKPQASEADAKAAAVQAVKDELTEAADGGMAPLTAAWERLLPAQRKYLQKFYDDELFPKATEADNQQEAAR
jgi:hypothetical protein